MIPQEIVPEDAGGTEQAPARKRARQRSRTNPKTPRCHMSRDIPYPFGIVPAHVWRVAPKPAPKISPPAAPQPGPPSGAARADEISAPAQMNHLPLQGGGKTRGVISKKSPRTPAPAWLPAGQDALRIALTRDLTSHARIWRHCPARVCRRHRCCASRFHDCHRLSERRRPPEHEQDTIADLQRAVKARLAALGPEER
jgi:hypothetical protein